MFPYKMVGNQGMVVIINVNFVTFFLHPTIGNPLTIVNSFLAEKSRPSWFSASPFIVNQQRSCQSPSNPSVDFQYSYFLKRK